MRELLASFVASLKDPIVDYFYSYFDSPVSFCALSSLLFFSRAEAGPSSPQLSGHAWVTLPANSHPTRRTLRLLVVAEISLYPHADTCAKKISPTGGASYLKTAISPLPNGGLS